MQLDNHGSDPGIKIIQATATAPLVDLTHVSNVTDLLLERLRLAPEHVAFEIRPEGGRLDAE